MFLGALLDAGLPRAQLVADLAGLGAAASPAGVARAARRARGALRRGRGARRARGARRPSRAPAHGHEHDHDHDHGHDHGHDHTTRPRPRRGALPRDRRRDLEARALAPDVRERALAIFEALGRAEARVHGIALAQVHFHEVGAVDAIVDVTGAAIALARLGIAAGDLLAGGAGQGSVETAHGRLPLPAPATLELLRGIPTVPAHVAWETVTPTGRGDPAQRGRRVRTAARDDRRGASATAPATTAPGPMPNVLRAVLGRAGGARARPRRRSLETNLDDLVPEHFDYLMERLLEAGALDVSIQHLQMKKNRPGLPACACSRARRIGSRSRGILFAESTAIGVRVSEYDRLRARARAAPGHDAPTAGSA